VGLDSAISIFVNAFQGGLRFIELKSKGERCVREPPPAQMIRTFRFYMLKLEPEVTRASILFYNGSLRIAD